MGHPRITSRHVLETPSSSAAPVGCAERAAPPAKEACSCPSTEDRMAAPSTPLSAFHEELLAGIRIDLSGSRGPDFISIAGRAGFVLTPSSVDELIMSLLWLQPADRLGLSPTAYLLYAFSSLDAVESDPPVVLSVKQRAAAAAGAASGAPALATLAGAAQLLKDALVTYSSLSLIDPDLLSNGMADADVTAVATSSPAAGRSPSTVATRLNIPPPLSPPVPQTPNCKAGHLELLRFLCPAGDTPPLSAGYLSALVAHCKREDTLASVFGPLLAGERGERACACLARPPAPSPRPRSTQSCPCAARRDTRRRSRRAMRLETTTTREETGGGRTTMQTGAGRGSTRPSFIAPGCTSLLPWVPATRSPRPHCGSSLPRSPPRPLPSGRPRMPLLRLPPRQTVARRSSAPRRLSPCFAASRCSASTTTS